jgi:hypothetical protein
MRGTVVDVKPSPSSNSFALPAMGQGNNEEKLMNY